MRVLVVEDDAPLANILTRVLREESYAVDRAEDGQEAEWLAFENPYDLIVLDLMLPVKDGLTVLRNVRKGGINAPVLILTARDAKEDIVRGLDDGADDYLTKPFSIEELLARVRVLMRRKDMKTQTEIVVGPIVINPARREVRRNGELIELTTKEYALFEYFARNCGTVLSRTQLSEHVWDQNFEPTSNVVDVYVGYLRNKIDKPYGTRYIRTVRGHGYMLDIPDEKTQPSVNQDKSPESLHAP
jgi:two-component system OmpR family response regulator